MERPTKAMRSRTETTVDTPSSPPDDTICSEVSRASSAAARSLQIPALGFRSDALRDEPPPTVLWEDAEIEEAAGKEREALLRGSAKGFLSKMEMWGEEEDGKKRDVAMAHLLVCNFLSGCTRTRTRSQQRSRIRHRTAHLGPSERLSLAVQREAWAFRERLVTRTNEPSAGGFGHTHSPMHLSSAMPPRRCPPRGPRQELRRHPSTSSANLPSHYRVVFFSS